MHTIKRGDRQIVLSRTFSGSPSAVFRALTDPEQIRQWMKPEGMSLVACEVDLRVGGSFRYRFQTANGRTIEVRGAFHRVDAPRDYRYTESYDFSPLILEVTTELEPAGGQTEFRQILGYRSKAERDADFDGIASSAALVYPIMDRFLQSQSVSRG